jgi:hypothetical protein
MSAMITYAITTPLVLNTTGNTNVTLPTSGTLLASVSGALAVTSGGTQLTSTTANQLLYSSAANTIAGLPTGNNGVLTTSASGVPSILPDGTTGQIFTAAPLPTWEASTAGNLVLIQSQTASASTSLTFNTGITTTYKTYLFVFSGIVLSSTFILLLNVSVNGGSSYLTTGYLSGLNYNEYNTATLTNVNSTTSIYTGYGSGKYDGYLWCYNILTSAQPYFSGTTVSFNAAPYTNAVFATNTTAGGVNAFQFTSSSSGTITSGTITLFGVLE